VLIQHARFVAAGRLLGPKAGRERRYWPHDRTCAAEREWRLPVRRGAL
jgi:hypothetical protein